MADLRVSELRTLLQGLLPGLIHELVPNCRREGSVLSAPNPRRNDGRHGSFKIWPNLGAWREYDEPEDTGKGDILDLPAYVAGYDPKSREGRKYAIGWAKHRLGLDTLKPDALLRVRRKLGAEAQKKRDAQAKAEAERAKRLYTRALDIWRQAMPNDAAVGAYLRARLGTDWAPAHPVPSLRLHPGLDHWAMPHAPSNAHRGPAMVARVMRLDGSFAAVHCTFLRDDFAGKAHMPNAKLMLSGITGAFVPLTLGEGGLTMQAAREAGRKCWLVAGEGIENAAALALSLPEARVWACLTLGNIAHVPLAPDVMAGVVMSLDNETKPEALKQRDGVIEKLAARCEAAGLPFRTMQPARSKGFAELLQETHDDSTDD